MSRDDGTDAGGDRPARRGRRRLTALLLVLGWAAALEITGLLTGSTVLTAAGLATLFVMLPPALVQVLLRDDDEDEDEDGGGGGPPRPNDPAPRSPTPGLDWERFDDLRRSWDRTPVGA